ncbi:metal ABC transporter substrate-binding protein [Natronobiforma cellulositropha]|uniref:metal ABC transporter substrate-binding protein n=1 Tax=Natronobiforma cellulositropha TaxID=1679076 RepID=UPI0021D5F12A|nr:zinc ABC transporter substrate-binding protein [Natronobiforma cellulositropha]
MDLTRRSILSSGAGVLTAGAFAGCLSSPSDWGGTDERRGYAAFFALWDWAEEVGGDTFEFENPIGVGEMGHGWEPDGNLAADIATTDVFVYLDTAEFAWAQQVVADLERDYDDVTIIDGMAGLSEHFLTVDREPPASPDTDYDFDPETLEVGGFDAIDRRTGEVVAYWHGDHWHGNLPAVVLDESVPIDAVITDDEERVLPLGADEQFQLDARLVDGAPESVEIDSHGEYVELHGVDDRTTLLVFELRADGEVIWDTSADSMSVSVVTEREDEAADEFVDPHVWVDPVLAQQIVATIADGLAEIDPDNADDYESNAAAYTERLEDVDRQFEELIDEASRTVGVFAGHDSYQYIEHRYGFELYTPVGISPDDAESFEDVASLIDVIEEYDIDTVLYDPFETNDPDHEVPNMVDVLIENTDATDYAPLTPAEGTTLEWNENGWGWVEQMEEINLPSLRKALGAE